MKFLHAMAANRNAVFGGTLRHLKKPCHPATVRGAGLDEGQLCIGVKAYSNSWMVCRVSPIANGGLVASAIRPWP